jgi:protein-S-isoprenylcysteine O-methyltransferase Ste14
MVNKKISNIAFKCRGVFWGIFAAGVLVFPESFSMGRFIAGFMILICGQALRLWAAGYIPKYRTEVIGAPVLVTWGPYGWVRNPLYAGNFIMGMGWALMVGWKWVIAFAIAYSLLYCLIVIPAEEEFLLSKFGDAYKEYKSKVPSLFPFPRGGSMSNSYEEQPFNAKVSWTQEIYSIRVNIIVTLLIVARFYFK